jgi:Uma2 family endonuclease
MSIAEPPRRLRTFADLVHDLGDIPLDRILASPPPGSATESDLLRLVDGVDPVLCELVDGTLVEKAVGVRESMLAFALGRYLLDYLNPRNLGIVLGPDGTLRISEGLVRLPEVAFVSWDRIPGRRVPDEPIPALAPDLAVEILSVSNTRAEMTRKRREYFRAGTRLVWEIDPRSRTVSVFTSENNVIERTESDTLDGGTVLPGLTIPVAGLFAVLDRHG